MTEKICYILCKKCGESRLNVYYLNNKNEQNMDNYKCKKCGQEKCLETIVQK